MIIQNATCDTRINTGFEEKSANLPPAGNLDNPSKCRKQVGGIRRNRILDLAGKLWTLGDLPEGEYQALIAHVRAEQSKSK